jgi:hypothetical protein
MKSNIAAAINAEHAKVEAAKQAGVQHARECGRLLCEAKETVAHGKWDAWVKANCSFSPRTAQLYMRVHKHLSGDPAKAQRVADLSLRELDREIAQPRPTKPRPFTIEEQRDFEELMRLWYSAKPHWRIGFLGELHRRGELTDDQFSRGVVAQALLIRPEEAAERMAEMLHKHIPRDLWPMLRAKMAACGESTAPIVKELNRIQAGWAH